MMRAVIEAGGYGFGMGTVYGALLCLLVAYLINTAEWFAASWNGGAA